MIPPPEFLDRVWALLEGLGADPASKPHFVRRWQHSPDWFGLALQSANCTFRVEGDRWYVTACDGGNVQHINDALESLRRESLGGEAAA